MIKINKIGATFLATVIAFVGVVQLVRAEATAGTTSAVKDTTDKAQVKALREQRIKQLDQCRAASKVAREVFNTAVKQNEKTYNAAVKAARTVLMEDLKAAGALPKDQRAQATKVAREKFQARVKAAKEVKAKANAEALKTKDASIQAAHTPCVVSLIHVPGYPSVLGDFTGKFKRPAGAAGDIPLPDGFVQKLEQREASESQDHKNENLREDRKTKIDQFKTQQQAHREKKADVANTLKECKKVAETAFNTAHKAAQTVYEAALQTARETLRAELATAADSVAKKTAQAKFVTAQKAALETRKTGRQAAADAKKAALKVCIDAAKAPVTTTSTGAQ